ncbi:hypothetical protein DLM75_13020 [Leptospira stimsonii]|uniref:Uncharacterized protein n=1 Tax=Leptospira stimsonii TaxID=2202203 RepID=A0A396Z331_9LEPT|nr:hypothetical protein DLM75_13020 [Leptospira stimsonii]
MDNMDQKYKTSSLALEIKIRLKNELIRCLSQEEDLEKVVELLSMTTLLWFRKNFLFPKL